MVVGSAVSPAYAQATKFDSTKCNYWNPPSGAEYDDETGEPLTEARQITRLAPEDAWKIATGKGVTVGVIDTGVDNIEMGYFSAPRVISA